MCAPVSCDIRNRTLLRATVAKAKKAQRIRSAVACCCSKMPIKNAAKRSAKQHPTAQEGTLRADQS
jgi:hypothetical protein